METLNAIFVGGSLTQSAWQVGGKNSAHVGRINADSAQWVWQKQFLEPGDAMHSITALSINPAGTKLACYGWENPLVNLGATDGFIFILDPGSGATASGMMKLTFSTPGYQVKSHGFKITADGSVFMAFNHLSTSTLSPEQMSLLGKWSSTANTMIMKRSAGSLYGVSASLA